MEIADDQLIFVATDTHRLARRVVSGLKPRELSQPFQTISPARALTELNRLLIDEDIPLKITVADNHLAFYTDEFYFYTKPIQGVYPDHRKVLPINFQNEISMEIDDLLPSIERAVLLVSTKDGTSIVHLNINPATLIIDSASADLGAVHEEIPITNDGEALNISFNTKYLLDSLKNMPSKQINLKFSGQLSPCIITPVSEEDYLYLLLPVRS
jgi:DNA polymerase-3 subunit beta